MISYGSLGNLSPPWSLYCSMLVFQFSVCCSVKLCQTIVNCCSGHGNWYKKNKPSVSRTINNDIIIQTDPSAPQCPWIHRSHVSFTAESEEVIFQLNLFLGFHRVTMQIYRKDILIGCMSIFFRAIIFNRSPLFLAQRPGDRALWEGKRCVDTPRGSGKKGLCELSAPDRHRSS